MLESGWKVVRKNYRDQFVSVYSQRQLVYSTVEFTKPFPTDGPLCVFNVYCHANDFAWRHQCDFVLPCLFERDTDNIDIWEQICEGQELYCYGNGLPLGTVLAKRVILDDGLGVIDITKGQL